MEIEQAGQKINSEKSESNENRAPKNSASVTVADDTALLNALTTNTPFTLAKKYVTICLPHSWQISLVPLMEALHTNTTVRTLHIAPRLWQPKELREFIWCLSSANKGIKKLAMQGHNFEPNFIEALTKILKLNRQIKSVVITYRSVTQFYNNGFARFCDGMEYYHFEELDFVNSGNSTDLFNTFFESLKYNQSIKVLRFIGENLSLSLPTLCNTLVANPTVTELRFDSCDLGTDRTFASLKSVLKANYLKTLAFRGTQINANMKLIAEELIANTSITELKLQQCDTDWDLLGRILAENKTITKLDISECNVTDRQIKQLNLGSNTSLTELNMMNCCRLTDYQTLLIGLMDNNSLKKLAFGHNTANVDPTTLEQYLSTNKSLTELSFDASYTKFKEKTFTAVANSLAVNKTLRKLVMPIVSIKYMTFVSIIEALKLNTTLLELHTVNFTKIYFRRKPSNGSEVDDLLLDLLKTNKTLRYIAEVEKYPYLEERLKENRETQDKIIHDTRTFINMIVTKPNSFILPVEIWMHIFKFVSYSFGAYDFERLFLSRDMVK